MRRQLVQQFERDHLAAILRETGGHVGDSTRRAGVDSRSMYGLMHKHGLRKEGFKSEGFKRHAFESAS